jgi:hypothetical protein
MQLVASSSVNGWSTEEIKAGLTIYGAILYAVDLTCFPPSFRQLQIIQQAHKMCACYYRWL